MRRGHPRRGLNNLKGYVGVSGVASPKGRRHQNNNLWGAIATAAARGGVASCVAPGPRRRVLPRILIVACLGYTVKRSKRANAPVV
ncbi:uncharacterized protein MICPUCDRAFT_51962 [Micromonas pusilla CCMP1545]|jgi:hypothetical protein|uniref:Predicted protein n=1 Tax=Micromonas pusilla (strain CCMP1545) TaxID=564608 RepID=C1N2Y3_MICPC|nr:uncharacterized protein MICPUCDRAFT_51962 [Micromonas pusilla CCMP1545]EEH53332.1 predicted protein [Micromonas pusilla CCMP1545]|eukprot:XP_003062513.1 predicted protein [Micromonas pusilla CCMP1545]